MPRQKPPAKPLYAVKASFYASLDAFAHEAGMLADAVKTALDIDCIDKRAKNLIARRLASFRAAQVGDESN